jgi:hypothetical protein
MGGGSRFSHSPPSMPPSESPTDALRAALSAVRSAKYHLSAERTNDLRNKVCAVVDELKASGVTPEQVLLVVKRIAADAEIGLAGVPVVDRMVAWCLEQYFKR